MHVHRQRLWAFTLSGALAGFAGALLVHQLGSITTEEVYLELTFITLAMLVVGGMTSLWGAVIGALAGFAGGLYVHMLGSITTDVVYLELTFITLAMLVIGGATSLWGAVIGALAVSALDSFLSQAEEGVNVGFTFDLPQGTRLVILGTVMATMLILRPSGITGGREFSLPRVRRPAARRPPTPEGTSP